MNHLTQIASKLPEYGLDAMLITSDAGERYALGFHGEGAPYSIRTKVAVLHYWGKLRSWQPYMVAHALWYKQTYTYFGILEALSGAGVDVVFMSFDDIRSSGIPEDVDVIINAGDAGTAWSGGDEWLDEQIVTAVRRFVWEGGGFVGVGEPSAVQRGGRYFQLADVLGWIKSRASALSTDKYHVTQADSHFITQDVPRDESGRLVLDLAKG